MRPAGPERARFLGASERNTTWSCGLRERSGFIARSNHTTGRARVAFADEAPPPVPR